MDFYANLHTHSTHSDGVHTPAELVRVAKKEGYSAIAVTDHDTVTGYPELKAECDKQGMECIFGAEFSAMDSPTIDRGFHIVGFDFDPEYPPMKEYLRIRSESTTEQTKVVTEWAIEKGGIKGITWDDVLEHNKGITWLANNHVFETMKAKGLVIQSDYKKFYFENYSVQRGWVKPLHPFKNVDETIKLIKDAGGIVIVAHPAEGGLDYIDKLIELGIDGIEVWHPDLNEEERERAYKIALEKNLFISGGADHSGFCGGLYSALKEGDENPWYIPPHSVGTTKEYFEEIKNRKLNRR